MTTANIKITKVLLGRGNTAISANYTGVMGEVTMDTTLKTLRVHDGNIAGGTRLATYQEVQDVATGNLDLSGYATTAQITAANASINSFKTYANVTFSTVANAASQQTQINSINANVLAANAAITALQSNAALQASLINTLTSNAATQGGALNDLVTNAAAQTQSLTTLTANAATQANSLTDLIANAAAQAQQIANVSGTYGNANVAAYLPTYTGNVRAGNINFNNGSRVQALNNNINLLANSNGAVELKSHGGNYIWGFDNFGFTILPETDPAYAPVANSSVLFAPTALAFKAGLTHLIFHANGLLDIPNGILMNNGSTLTSGSLNAGAGGSAILSTNDGHNQVYTEDFDAGASAGIWIQTSTDGNTYSNWVFQANGNLSAGGNLIPSANVTYSLGSNTHQWKDLWVSNNTIYIGGTPVRVDGGTLLVNNSPVSGGSNIGNLQIDNNNNQLSFGPGESYSFLYMKNDGSETRLANDNGNVQISTIKQGLGGGTYYWTFSDLGHLALPFGSQLVTFDSNSVELTAGNGLNSYASLASFNANNYIWVDNAAAYIGTSWQSGNKVWTYGTDGTLTVPLQPGSASNQIKYGMGNLVAYNDGGWTLGEYNGDNFGMTGMRINPGIEGYADLYMPSDSGATTDPVRLSNYFQFGNVAVRASNKEWKFGFDGNLTIPGSITYANGASILSDYATISSTLNTSTTSQSTNDFVGGNYYNADTLSVEYTAYTGASTLNFNLGYQKPLDGNIGITVAAISTPLIQSLDGTLTMPVNITGANVISASTFVSNSFNVVTAGNLSITSQYGLGTTGTILEDNGTLELIAKGGGAVVAGWDSTYGNGLGNIATINFNEVGGEGIVLRTGNRAATEYNWVFDKTGGLTFPAGGNVTFDSSAVSTIDGVTNINAVGTVGANVIQVLDSITSFGASPAPTISGFRSIATTGSAVNEGNISASGNLVAGRNAYVTGNVFAAQYNYANGVSISQSIQNGISNVRVLSSGGLVSINVGGASNIALFTTTGASIGGTLSTSGLTATGAVTLATASGNINIGASQTTGHVNMGGTAQTGTILIGQSTYPQTINIGHGVTGSGNTKTIQIGENGAAGSTTLIDIGPATASATGTVTFNTATVVTIANTGGSALSVTGNITGGNVTAAQYNFANGVNILSTTISGVANAYVAIGTGAGTTAQGLGSVAVGLNAGNNTQGYYSVAVGVAAGRESQGDSTVAIGGEAGGDSQGQFAVAVGYRAGRTSQAARSIVLNATGANLNVSTTDTLTVAPVRNAAGTDGLLQYNNTTKEVTYSSTLGGNLIVTGNITQQSAYYETYSNVVNSGGNLTCNFVNGGTFYATLTANVTANFTNVALTTGTIVGATIIVDQGATPYQISNVQVNGGGIQTVKWAGGVGQNPGTGSNTDVMSFSLINLGGGAWRVLGQIANYG